MSVRELLAFSEAQQQAVIGHALQHQKVWELLEGFGINDKWIESAALAETFKELVKFQDEFERLPKSIAEALDFIKDEMTKGAVNRTLLKCIEEKKKHPWDVLEKKVVGWAKSRLLSVTAIEVTEKYNAGKHKEAEEILQRTALDLQRMNCLAGAGEDEFVSAAVRCKEVEQQIEKEAAKVIKYSIPYLQDALGGMLPCEVVLWGATSGAGKTEAARIQACYTAKETKEPVHYFALEADYREIEMRTKFSIMGREYKNDHTGIPAGFLTFANFRLNRLNQEFAPYVKLANDEFERDYSTLQVYYKKAGDFTPSTLEKRLIGLKGRSRLIVLDHIHYLDLESENETRALSLLMGRIRTLIGLIEIPIILVAHITEKGNMHGELIPRKTDYYGASNQFKISTTAIMMAQARGLIATDSRACGVPTLIGIVKNRLNGSLQYLPGLCFFNLSVSNYTPYYAVGKFESGNKKWKPMKGDLPYWIDKVNCITDVGDIG
jgi:hypothetical protein